MQRACLIVAVSLAPGCGDMMITRRIYSGLRITVTGLPAGESAEDYVLEDLPAMEVDLGEQLTDEGINREDIGEAVLEEFWLEADDPEPGRPVDGAVRIGVASGRGALRPRHARRPNQVPRNNRHGCQRSWRVAEGRSGVDRKPNSGMPLDREKPSYVCIRE